MGTTFYIVLNIKTVSGFESYGRFYVGNDKDFAYSVFRKLQGSDDVDEKSVLHLDFIEIKENLPVNIKVIGCTLDEVAKNCKIITKEVFKFLNLEEM